ncbi:rhodanese-related sulfurtransferase [soil metagenome]
MNMEKIILYYKFVPIPDTESVLLWQRALCEKLGLKGRILISGKGLNGTLGGDIKALKAYKKAMNEHSLFKEIEYKWSDGKADDFPKLSIKVRSETVTLGWEPHVGKSGVIGGGKHLKPAAVHELVKNRGDDVVFFDGRNKYEASIGKFKNAVVPDVNTFKEYLTELDKPEYDEIKQKPVVTYCTGGIRCETLSALMIEKGFQEVYQMDGGIVKYGEKYKDAGFWEGKLFVFDKRMKLDFSDKAKDIAVCEKCGAKTSNQVNSTNIRRRLHIICENCTKLFTKV